jgi:hypothetical protein
MFGICSGLTTPPELPATTMETSCYAYMFQNCKSLTTAPELPALTLTGKCYEMMFAGCSNLNYVKCLATSGAQTHTSAWLQNVSETGTFVKNAEMHDWEQSLSPDGIPNEWTVEDAS